MVGSFQEGASLLLIFGRLMRNKLNKEVNMPTKKFTTPRKAAPKKVAPKKVTPRKVKPKVLKPLTVVTVDLPGTRTISYYDNPTVLLSDIPIAEVKQQVKEFGFDSGCATVHMEDRKLVFSGGWRALIFTGEQLKKRLK